MINQVFRSMATSLLVASGLALGMGTAHAIPALQLYIEGAVYDAGTETWVVNTDFSSPLRLWTIANTGSVGTIYDAKLAVAYGAGTTPDISFTSTTTGGIGGFTDTSVATSPTLTKTVTDGSAPLMGDGSSLPRHGVYGDGTWWQEFALGDFDLVDSPIADFIDSFPDPTAQMGQINVYEIAVSGADYLHFDFYDHYLSKTGSYKYRFAPFSHDAEAKVSKPGPLALFEAGLLAIGIVQLTKRRKTR